MKDLKAIFWIAVVVTIGWHAKEYFFSSKTKISGVFQTKPKDGYGWENSGKGIGGVGCTYEINEFAKLPQVKTVMFGSPAYTAGLREGDFIVKVGWTPTYGVSHESVRNMLRGAVGSFCNITYKRNGVEQNRLLTRARFSEIEDDLRLKAAYKPKARYFWDNTKVKWCPGFVHPDHNVYAAEKEGSWAPKPGYVFSNKEKLETRWRAGLKHPTMNAYSATEEKRWAAGIGYEFVMENGVVAGTKWSSGTRYADLKITASGTEGMFYSFPGYTFTNPKKSLDVVWTPGLLDPAYHPGQVSGSIEGQWNNIQETSEYTASTEPTWKDHIAASIITAGAAELGEWLFGKNFFSNQLNQASGEEFVRGVIKAVE